MKKSCVKALLLLIVLVLTAGCLAACGGKPASTDPAEESGTEEVGSCLVGKWAYADMRNFCYVFNEDGTGIYSTDGGKTGFFEFSWTDNGDSVTLDYTNVDEPATFRYTIQGKTLSIEDSFGDFNDYVKA